MRLLKWLGIYNVKYADNNRRQWFLFGLVHTRKTFYPYDKKIIILFLLQISKHNVGLIKRRTRIEIINPIRKITEFIFKQNFILASHTKIMTEQWITKIHNQIGKKHNHDDIYIITCASGEAYLFLHAIKSILQHNNSVRPAIVATCQYHMDLAKMYAPDIPVYHVPYRDLCFDNRHIIAMGNRRYFILFPFKHFSDWENDLRQHRERHYYLNILDLFGIDAADITPHRPQIPESAERTAISKAHEVNLDTDNFILVSPEARSNPSLSPQFWIMLDKKLKTRGFDVFFNIFDNTDAFDGNMKHIRLSVLEINALAQHARAIIGIKSGLMEPFYTIPDIPIINIFTPMFSRCYDMLKPMTCENHMRGCATNLLPHTTGYITDINGDKFTENEILHQILDIVDQRCKK